MIGIVGLFFFMIGYARVRKDLRDNAPSVSTSKLAMALVIGI
jgi:hypothetical protein